MSKRNLATVTCSLSQSDLLEFVEQYGISMCYDPQLPSSDKTALDASEGYIHLYLSLFTIGNLRLPLNDFCLDMAFLNFMKKPGQTPSFSVRPTDQPIDVGSLSVDLLKVTVENDQVESSSVSKDKDASGLELTVVSEGFLGQNADVAKVSKKMSSITESLEEEAMGVGKHPRVLARYTRNLASSSNSLAPDIEEAYYAHNTLSNLHYPLLKDKLGFLTFDKLVNVYDVYALQMAVVGNMLTNKSQIISRDHTQLKDDFNLKELSMLRSVSASAEDSRKKLYKELEGLKPHFKEAERLGQRCQDLESEKDFLLKEAEKVVDLSSKLKAVELEKDELVKDLLPLAIKKLFESEHFNHALGDL
ncbi:hypothetical protein Tco_1007252 [Tanacetum coccineum]